MAPARRLRALAQGLGLLALSSACALAGGEWFLRHYLPQAGFVYRLQPRCLYTLAPGARRLFEHSPRNGGGRVLLVVNSRGFREPELRARPGLRVLVYGDSFVEGDYAKVEETFARRLALRLSAKLGRDVEAVNGGVNGYGPDQSLRRFEDEAAILRPAAVVFTIFADNDFGDVLRNRLYRLDGGRLVDGGGYVAASLRQEFQDAEERTPFHLLRGIRRLRNAHRRAAAREQLPQKLAIYIARSLEMSADEYRRIVAGGERAVDDIFRDHYDADVALLPGSAAAGYKRALLEAVLGRWRQASEAAGVPVLAVVIPSPIDICEHYDVKVDRAAYPQYDPRRLSREVAEAAARQGLPAVDLFAPFEAAGAESLYYLHDDDHWNPAGQDLAAQLTAERLLSEGWLRGDPPGNR